jgi:hypothetical protein
MNMKKRYKGGGKRGRERGREGIDEKRTYIFFKKSSKYESNHT